MPAVSTAMAVAAADSARLLIHPLRGLAVVEAPAPVAEAVPLPHAGGWLLWVWLGVLVVAALLALVAGRLGAGRMAVGVLAGVRARLGGHAGVVTDDDESIGVPPVATAAATLAAGLSGGLVAHGALVLMQTGQASQWTLALAVAAGVALAVLQWVACRVLGWVFAPPAVRGALLQADVASHWIMAVVWIGVALLLTVMPEHGRTLLAVAAGGYVLARMVVVIRGLCIFYRNLTSCVYLFLYLCGVEVVPVVALTRLTLWLCES